MKGKKQFGVLFAAFCVCMTVSVEPGEAARAQGKISAEAKQCIACHETRSPSFVRYWRTSKHAEKGVDACACEA